MASCPPTGPRSNWSRRSPPWRSPPIWPPTPSSSTWNEPAGPDGLVRLDADVVLIRPARDGSAQTGGPLLFSVANRGLVTALPLSWGVQAGAIPDGQVDPGDGWILRRGMSVAWVGWQWDVQRRPGVVGVDVPAGAQPRWPAHPQPGPSGVLPARRQPHRRLADEVSPWMGQFHALAAADPHERHATLTVRDWFNGPRQTIDRAQWRFARDVDGSPVPTMSTCGSRVGLPPAATTRSPTPPVAPDCRAGLAAVRDVVAYLRSTMGFERVLTLGISQSGRWLRQFIFDTANTAEDGSPGLRRRLLPHRRWAERRVQQPQRPTLHHERPRLYPPTAILARDRPFRRGSPPGNAPLTIFANSATEYWRGDASLVHTDARAGISPTGWTGGPISTPVRTTRRLTRRVRGPVPGPVRPTGSRSWA